jgi:hypothetical protein
MEESHMALKNLTENEMIELSSAWLDPERAGGALATYPLLAALRPAIKLAHDGLLTGDGAPADATRDKERTRLYEQGVALDQRHDRKGRGVFNLLTALSDLTDDPGQAEVLLALRHALFPDDNLAVLAASWKGEAGNARRVREKVLGDKAASASLKAIPTNGKHTALDEVRAFVGAAEALGALEDQRAALGDAGTAGVDTRAARAKARNRWIAVGNSLVSLADDMLELDGDARRALLGGVSDAEKKADARALARRPVEAAPVKPEGGTVEG